MSKTIDQTAGLAMFETPLEEVRGLDPGEPPKGLAGLRYLAKVGREKCPCCGRGVGVYKRKFNSGMAATLCIIVARHGMAWVHVNSDLWVNKIANRNRNHGYLVHWGLLEKQDNEDPSKRDAGVFRATQKGVGFVNNHLRAPTHFFQRVPGNECLGFEDKTLNVHDALGNAFSYGDLMGGDGEI